MEVKPAAMGDGGSDGDVGDLILNDYCDYGWPEEDPESKVVDVYDHALKEEPKEELGDGDGDAVEVNGYCDYDPPKREPEPVLPATSDGTGTDGGRDVGYDCSHCGIILSTEEFKVKHELRCEVRMKQKELEPQVTKLYQCGYCRCPFLSEKYKERHQQKFCPKSPVATRKDSKKDNFKTHVAKHGKNDAKWFTCMQCSYKTVRKYAMTKHVKFSCCRPICGRSFRTKRSLDDHRHSDEPDQVSKLISSKTYTYNICNKYKTRRKADYFQCDKCKYVTKWKHNLKKHFLTHNKNNAEWFTCTQCPFKTMHKHNMTRHMKVHDNTFSFCRPICGKSFRTKLNLDDHLVGQHSDESGEVSKAIKCKTYTYDVCNKYKTQRKADYFECDKCKFFTKWKHNLERHLLTRHMKIHDRCGCPICGKNFRTKLILDDHLVRQHPDESDQVSKLISGKTYSSNICNKYKTQRKADYFKCDKCKFFTKWKHSLERHVLKHNKNNAEWLTCTQCSYKTVYKHCMSRHMKIHHNTTSYFCPVCRKNFRTKRGLDDHRHSDESDQVSKLISSKTYSSNICNKYKTQRKADYFECDKCKYVTKWKGNLERHLLKHNKKNAECFTCTQCLYKTVHKSNMTRHTKIHDNTTSHFCQICRKRFKKKQCLDDHLLRQHSDDSDEVSKLISSKTYTCNICDKFRTTSKTDFNRHLIVTHLKGVGCQKYE